MTRGGISKIRVRRSVCQSSLSGAIDFRFKSEVLNLERRFTFGQISTMWRVFVDFEQGRENNTKMYMHLSPIFKAVLEHTFFKFWLIAKNASIDTYLIISILRWGLWLRLVLIFHLFRCKKRKRLCTQWAHAVSNDLKTALTLRVALPSYWFLRNCLRKTKQRNFIGYKSSLYILELF